MVRVELRQLAGELNIPGTAGMRKGDLIAAIKEKQGGASARKPAAAQLSLPDNSVPAAAGTDVPTVADAASTNGAAQAEATPAAAPPTRRRRTASRPAGAPDVTTAVEAPAANGSPVANGGPVVTPPAVDAA